MTLIAPGIEQKELILSTENVSFTYDGDKKILKNINFQIHDIVRTGMIQGQIIAICGRSGCGKSTLFKILSGFQKPTAGEVKVDLDQHQVSMGEMGVVPQDYPLFNHRTVYGNLSLALTGKTDKEKLDIINEYAKYFDLLEELEKYPVELSGGQRQRASILQQVLAGNKFILMDEPFSGLDSIMKDKVVDLLIKVDNLNEYNTLIIVSHDIESSCAIADSVYVLANNDGEGSTVVKSYDMIKLGLAYRKGIKEDRAFQDVVKEIKSLM